jgi:putative transposase
VKVHRASSAVYEIAYHIVWCPKSRKRLPEAVQRSLKLSIRSIAEARGWEVKELEVMPDHVHLFIGAPPTESPTGIVKILKGTTGVLMFREHPSLQRTFRHGHLWSPSYYVGTFGHISAETVARYVRDQKLHVVGRPKGGSFPPWQPSSPQQVGGSPAA